MVTDSQRSRPLAPARLALADGSVFRGQAFGAVGQGLATTGEVVFNTAHTGYQESLTDPSYAGQILVQTFPLIGNTGVNPEDTESSRVQVAGFVVRELARRHSNWRSSRDLDAELREQGVLAITGIDTRALVRRIRERGAMPGVLTDRSDLTDEALVEMARTAPSMEGQDLATAARDGADGWSETLGSWGDVTAGGEGDPLRVLAIDCGAKRNILRHLVTRGCTVRLVSPDTPAAELRAMLEAGGYDGLFISNGPGDPAAVEATIAALRDAVFGERRPLPTFGICLGHQLLALAAGARTYKLPFGHRGANQPVRDNDHDRVCITSQNHGFAVDRASLETLGARVTHTHLNDDTVAGFAVDSRGVRAVQFHPEASPGPHDAGTLFDAFVAAMRQARSS